MVVKLRVPRFERAKTGLRGDEEEPFVPSSASFDEGREARGYFREGRQKNPPPNPPIPPLASEPDSVDESPSSTRVMTSAISSWTLQEPGRTSRGRTDLRSSATALCVR